MSRREEIEFIVDADTARYQAKFAQIPGTTDKAAQKSALAFQRAFNNAQVKAAIQAELQAKKVTSAWDNVHFAVGFADIERAVTAVTGLVQNVADLRNQLNDAATATGLSTRTLAGLKLAAEGSGDTLDDLMSSLQRLPKTIVDVASGTGSAGAAFEALGVSATDANGKLRSADDVIRDLLDGLAKVEDPTQRAALATIAFGKSGTSLLQALGDPTALDHFVDQAERFGTDVGPEASAGADQWQRSLADLWLVLEGAGSDLSDFLNVGSSLDNFTLGFVHAFNTVSAVLDAYIAQIAIVQGIAKAWWEGDEEAVAAWQAQLDNYNLDTALAAADEATASFVANRDAIRDSSVAIDENAAAAGAGADAIVEAAKAAEEKAAADKAAKKAAADSAKADREKVKSLEAAKKAYEDLLDATRDLYKIQEEANSDLVTAEEEIQAAFEAREVAARKAFAESAKDTEDQLALGSALADSEARMVRDLYALKEEYAAKDREREDARLEEMRERAEAEWEIRRELGERIADEQEAMAEARAERERFYAQSAIDGIDMIATAGLEQVAQQQEAETQRHEANIARIENELKTNDKLSTGQRAALKARLAAERAALRDQAKREHDMAVYQLALQQAIAFAKAVASSPPPFNLGVLAAQAGMFALPVGLLAAAKPPAMFDGGRIRRPQSGANNEVPIVGHVDEHVVRSGPANRYREQLDELNATGRWPAGGSSGTELVLDGRAAGRIVQRGVQFADDARVAIRGAVSGGNGFRQGYT